MRHLVIASALLALAACAGPQRAEHQNLCDDSATRCVAGDACTWDESRGCFHCYCTEADGPPPRPDWLPERPGPPPPRP